MRVINVAAAQMGPIQRAESRQAVIPRMIALLDEAKARGADLIVYPELALTTFFPRWYIEDQAEVDGWFDGCDRPEPVRSWHWPAHDRRTVGRAWPADGDGDRTALLRLRGGPARHRFTLL